MANRETVEEEQNMAPVEVKTVKVQICYVYHTCGFNNVCHIDDHNEIKPFRIAI